MILYCATSNAGKLREFQLAASESFQIEPLKSVPPCAETGSSFRENALQKALYYGAHCGEYLFAEDSGLEVEALNGEPGICSARFAGLNASDEENNRQVLARLGQSKNRRARFVCAIALVRGGVWLESFEASVEGELLFEPCGTAGFGYDPLFLYPPLGKTFGELTADLKNTVSHRAQALRHLFAFLKSA